MIVVSNASPLIILAKIIYFHLPQLPAAFTSKFLSPIPLPDDGANVMIQTSKHGD